MTNRTQQEPPANLQHWLVRLQDHRTRHAARKALLACGPAAADAVLRFAQNPDVKENALWAALSLLSEWKWQPAVPLLVKLLPAPGLHAEMHRALNTITGANLDDNPDSWNQWLNPQAAATATDPAGATPPLDAAAPLPEDAPAAFALMRQALDGTGVGLSWEGGYALMRCPAENERSQQVLALFQERDEPPASQAGITFYTECGAATPAASDILTRRNVTVRFGKFQVGRNAAGAECVMLQAFLPAARITVERLRDMVPTLAQDADSFEYEMTHADVV